MRRTGTFVLIALLAAPHAGAVDATTLFKQGLAAFQRGDTATACGLFEQSYKLDAATGTLFNMAKCHATEGHYWQARGEFLKLAGEMDRAGKADKAKIARDAAADAEKHVPKLALTFPDASNVETIAIDGDELDQAKWKTPIAVAPGSHVLTFGAAGTQKQTRTIEAQADGAIVEVDVPVLVAGAARGPEGAPTPRPDRTPVQSAGSTGRTTGLIIGSGVTVAGLATGVGFMLAAASARSKRDDLLSALQRKTGNSDPCGTDPAPAGCADIFSANDGATNDKTGVIVGFSVAGVAAAGTLAILLWPRAPNDTAIVPVMGKHVAGLAAAGSF